MRRQDYERQPCRKPLPINETTVGVAADIKQVVLMSNGGDSPTHVGIVVDVSVLKNEVIIECLTKQDLDDTILILIAARNAMWPNP